MMKKAVGNRREGNSKKERRCRLGSTTLQYSITPTLRFSQFSSPGFAMKIERGEFLLRLRVAQRAFQDEVEQ